MYRAPLKRLNPVHLASSIPRGVSLPHFFSPSRFFHASRQSLHQNGRPRRPKLNVPLNGHPAGYILVAIIGGMIGYEWNRQQQQQQPQGRKSHGKERSDPSSASTSSSSADGSKFTIHSNESLPMPTRTEENGVVPFNLNLPSSMAGATLQPFQWPMLDDSASSNGADTSKSSRLPSVNILTSLSSNEVASHPLLANIGRFGLPTLPFLPETIGHAGVPIEPFHLAPPLFLRRSFLTAYNTKTRTADWCLERLAKEEVLQRSSASRDSCTFTSDPFIQSAFQSHSNDYRSSGYDRGHLVPAADVPLTDTDPLHPHSAMDALAETFVLSNVAPQAPALNRGYWVQMEHHIRTLTKTYEEVYVVTGPLWIPTNQSPSNTPSTAPTDSQSFALATTTTATKSSSSSSLTPPTIHTPVLGPSLTSFVHVPTHFFKIVLVVPKGSKSSSSSSSSSPSSPRPPLIASFILPNSSTPIPLSVPLTQFEVSLEQVELLSGWQFFPRLQRPINNGSNTATKSRFRRATSSDDRTAASSLCSTGACTMQIKEFNFQNKHQHKL